MRYHGYCRRRVLTHEEVVGIGAHAAVLEELEQVVELPVDVAADRHWRVDMLHVGLLHEDLARLEAQVTDLLFGDLLALLEQLYLPVQKNAGGCNAADEVLKLAVAAQATALACLSIQYGVHRTHLSKSDGIGKPGSPCCCRSSLLDWDLREPPGWTQTGPWRSRSGESRAQSDSRTRVRPKGSCGFKSARGPSEDVIIQLARSVLAWPCRCLGAESSLN